MRILSISLLLVLALQATAADTKRPFAIVGTAGDPPAPDFDKDSGITIHHVASASVEKYKTMASDGAFKDSYGLSVVLTDDGALLNRKFTDAWVDRRIAVIIDDVIIGLPVIAAVSARDFVVSVPRDMRREDIERLAQRLNAGQP